MRIIKILKTGILIVTLIVFLSACSSENQLLLDPDESVTLKVMYPFELEFYNQYGNMFIAQHPNVHFEILSTQRIYEGIGQDSFDPIAAYESFVEEHQPDIILMNFEHYEKFVQEGKLVDLDHLIQTHEYDMSTYSTSILEVLRGKGGGKLYGLSPTFVSQALFYNIDLFEEHGLDIPNDHMTWEDVLFQASRFPADADPESRIYGFSLGQYTSYDSLVLQIAETEGLLAYNEASQEFTIDTESWREVLHLAIDTFKSGSVYIPEDQQVSISTPRNRNLFLTGKSAMAVDDFNLVQSLLQSNDNSSPINYGIVTAPVNSSNSDLGAKIKLGSLFGINARSTNQNAAWKFMEYINSELYSEVLSRSSPHLLSRKPENTERYGVDLSVFYELEANPQDRERYGLPAEAYNHFRGLLNTHLSEAVHGDLMVDTILSEIEQELTMVFNEVE